MVLIRTTVVALAASLLLVLGWATSTSADAQAVGCVIYPNIPREHGDVAAPVSMEGEGEMTCIHPYSTGIRTGLQEFRPRPWWNPFRREWYSVSWSYAWANSYTRHISQSMGINCASRTKTQWRTFVLGRFINEENRMQTGADYSLPMTARCRVPYHHISAPWVS